MGQFKCPACGNFYNDDFNFTVCPFCGGCGLADPKCTCRCLHRPFGGPKTAVVTEPNPSCPIHGKKK